MDMLTVDLSRLLFAISAHYHYIFVPLTLGLSFVMAIMESIYVKTGHSIYKDMTQFWGKLFGINFAMGIATGITLEFQFGTNWSYYALYVGDVFGAPLAIEGMMAFFLESTFIGLFFFGWDRLTKRQHLVTTWLVALGANLSAVWIIIANGWMQNPVGSFFNPETLRMELASFSEVIFNPNAQIKFAHTIFAGYVTGAFFVMGVSAYYLLKKRHQSVAIRSLFIGSVFGFLSAMGVAFFGDISGRIVFQDQKSKFAAMEAEWETEEAPAAFKLFALPDQANQTNRFVVQVPYVLGILATLSLDEPIPGIKDIIHENESKVRKGIEAYHMLTHIREGDASAEDIQLFQEKSQYLGYGYLLKRYLDDPTQATETQIKQAAQDTIPKSWPLFFSFRIMFALGFLMIFVSAGSIYMVWRNASDIDKIPAWFYRIVLWTLPAPWIANSFGWFLAEYGRQPWTIFGVLPTFLSASNTSLSHILISLGVIISFYTFLLVIEMFLMLKYIKLGPTPGPKQPTSSL